MSVCGEGVAFVAACGLELAAKRQVPRKIMENITA
jgi:hypothetical protein